jgi:hypothetical protein
LYSCIINGMFECSTQWTTNISQIWKFQFQNLIIVSKFQFLIFFFIVLISIFFSQIVFSFSIWCKTLVKWIQGEYILLIKILSSIFISCYIFYFVYSYEYRFVNMYFQINQCFLYYFYSFVFYFSKLFLTFFYICLYVNFMFVNPFS